jgi:hypothetical protein
MSSNGSLLNKLDNKHLWVLDYSWNARSVLSNLGLANVFFGDLKEAAAREYGVGQKKAV